MPKLQSQFVMLSFCFIFTLLCRLLPHIPNVSPLLGFALFAGSQLPRRYAVLYLFSCCLTSDLLLSLLYHYPFLTQGSFFTYSGWLFVLLLGKQTYNKYGLTGIGSLLFWVWTNLGVWLTTNLYPHHAQGLLQC